MPQATAFYILEFSDGPRIFRRGDISFRPFLRFAKTVLGRIFSLRAWLLSDGG